MENIYNCDQIIEKPDDYTKQTVFVVKRPVLPILSDGYIEQIDIKQPVSETKNIVKRPVLPILPDGYNKRTDL
jgi:hypothetical protein